MTDDSGPTASPSSDGEAVLSLRDATLRFGERTLWSHLDLDVRAGEFVAILGANGSGKSSLLKAILGQVALSSGTATFLGRPITRGNRRIGYVPQQKLADEGVAIAQMVKERVFQSRLKDYNDPFRKIVYDNQEEMDAVIGSINDNDFIAHSEAVCQQTLNDIESLFVRKYTA